MSRSDAVENTFRLLRADPPFAAWSRPYPSLETAWTNCPNPQWMLWLLATLDLRDLRLPRHFAIACATRVLPLASSEACAQAIEIATLVARGEAPATALAPAYRAAQRQAEQIATQLDFSESRAAATAAAAATVRAHPFDASRDASREALRAVTWHLAGEISAADEAAFQTTELRRLVHDEIPTLFDHARARTRGKLALL